VNKQVDYKMNKLSKLRNIILYFWMLPQNILGLILIVLFTKKITSLKTSKRVSVNIYYLDKNVDFAAISLGRYLLISSTYNDKETIERHEEGHYIQSLYFGPLYLIVIGIPSILMNILSMYFYKKGKSNMLENYYNRWPENWADKLGGVNRSNLK
jgi:hypothetical protein